MFNPNADPFFRHVVRVYHQELLQEIESGWFYRQPELLERIIDQIKIAQQWIKCHTRSAKPEPCFDGS
jgi:hypothetical protein